MRLDHGIFLGWPAPYSPTLLTKLLKQFTDNERYFEALKKVNVALGTSIILHICIPGLY